MLTDTQIERNKSRYISLLKEIKRDGALIDDLINTLEQSDFFIAPASTQYHNSFKGGLCDHCLHVYDELSKIVSMEYDTEVLTGDSIVKIEEQHPYDNESLIVVALLHDLAKMDYYEVTTRNTKDENGNWIQVPFIKVREAKDRFLYGSHGANSKYIAESFIPLTTEEAAAILNHMGGKESSAVTLDGDLSGIYNRYQLALYLHVADMLATFHDEKLF